MSGYKDPPKHSKFKPGQSGNPAGRPKGIPNTATRLKRFLDLTVKNINPVNGQEEIFTVAEEMDLAIIAKARKGDTKAYNALIDRLEGKPQQRTDITSNGEPIPILGGTSELPSDNSPDEDTSTQETN